MPKILLVEDERDIALVLKNDLALEGYDVEAVHDGLAGFERARTGAFDLILLDLMLPKKDGYAVCRELRAAGVRTPILMLTARAQEAEKILGLELGADDYVTKPFSPLELRARVKAMLRRAAPPPADTSRFGDVEVDFARAEVHRNGVLLETTPLEFKLLDTFLKRRGRVLTREQLLDEVWRPDSSPTDRVIDNHIMNLRRKIEPDPQQPRYIVSVRGLGYRFDG
ncbi:MAG: response regulator transcription factor [Bryobacter sp.]|jgi:two-component system alkaline phosphatase synthesis response regulator PhoP|nr:response regulator transcription factor [Bryobacter sp.]